MIPVGGVPNPVFRRFLEMGAILGLKAKMTRTCIDVIGYKRRTSDVVVGDKCWTVMLKCERHKFFCDKKCSFIRTKYLNNRWNRFSYDFMKNMISMLW